MLCGEILTSLLLCCDSRLKTNKTTKTPLPFFVLVVCIYFGSGTPLLNPIWMSNQTPYWPARVYLAFTLSNWDLKPHNTWSRGSMAAYVILFRHVRCHLAGVCCNFLSLACLCRCTENCPVGHRLAETLLLKRLAFLVDGYVVNNTSSDTWKIQVCFPDRADDLGFYFLALYIRIQNNHLIPHKYNDMSRRGICCWSWTCS